MSLETAIHKMTGLTAEHMGIGNRGLIVRDYFADLVLLNPATVTDNATMSDPTLLSAGIDMVWVNGELVYSNQKATQRHPGVFITREE
jgi:N-acyl-D-amino-acid deacylase